MVSATHEVFKGVNLIDHVSLEDRLRIHGYGVGCGVGEYVLPFEVITLGNRRWLSLLSTGREVVYP